MHLNCTSSWIHICTQSAYLIFLNFSFIMIVHSFFFFFSFSIFYIFFLLISGFYIYFFHFYFTKAFHTNWTVINEILTYCFFVYLFLCAFIEEDERILILSLNLEREKPEDSEQIIWVFFFFFQKVFFIKVDYIFSSCCYTDQICLQVWLKPGVTEKLWTSASVNRIGYQPRIYVDARD